MALYVRKYLAFSAGDIGSGACSKSRRSIGDIAGNILGAVVQQTLGVPLAESARMFVPRWNIVVAYWTAAVEPILDAATHPTLDIGPILASRTESGRGACPSVCLLVGGPVTITIVFKKGNAMTVKDSLEKR
jgi:hypothetical protein